MDGEALFDRKDNNISTIDFDVETVYSFIDCDMNNENVGKMTGNGDMKLMLMKVSPSWCMFRRFLVIDVHTHQPKKIIA